MKNGFFFTEISTYQQIIYLLCPTFKKKKDEQFLVYTWKNPKWCMVL